MKHIIIVVALFCLCNKIWGTTTADKDKTTATMAAIQTKMAAAQYSDALQELIPLLLGHETPFMLSYLTADLLRDYPDARTTLDETLTVLKNKILKEPVKQNFAAYMAFYANYVNFVNLSRNLEKDPALELELIRTLAQESPQKFKIISPTITHFLIKNNEFELATKCMYYGDYKKYFDRQVYSFLSSLQGEKSTDATMATMQLFVESINDLLIILQHYKNYDMLEKIETQAREILTEHGFDSTQIQLAPSNAKNNLTD